jgi:hypothetical protein
METIAFGFYTTLGIAAGIGGRNSPTQQADCDHQSKYFGRCSSQQRGRSPLFGIPSSLMGKEKKVKTCKAYSLTKRSLVNAAKDSS